MATLHTDPPARGKLLVANPFLPDPNFQRTVVLLVDHDDEGTLGFVLNRLSDVRLSDLLDGLPEADAPLVHIGGPVHLDRLNVLHRLEGIPGSEPVGHDLYWGGNPRLLRQGLLTNQFAAEDTRYFLGNSGWGNGQLAQELRERVWIVTDPPAALLHIPPDQLWRQVLIAMGGEYAMMANFPLDPRLN